MNLPPFQEPDWSTLPPEAVAWAVQGDGSVWSYAGIPTSGKHYDGWLGGDWIERHSVVDMTGIDWRTTLRLRPAKVDHRPEIKTLTQAVEGLTSEQRNYELERLAEEAWKALLADCGSYQDAAVGAFNAAEHFISEREKRRNK